MQNIIECNYFYSCNSKSDDIKRCESLFQKYLGVTVSITNAFHLGKKSDKPHLLKITLGDIQEKIAILKSKSKLRSSQNPQHIRDVFVMPNFTRLEQKKNIELCEELADMNKSENIYLCNKKREDSAEAKLDCCTDNQLFTSLDNSQSPYKW